MSTWYKSPSGRLHTLKSCSSGAPADRMVKVDAPRPSTARVLLAKANRPGICRCAWRAAQKIIDNGPTTLDASKLPEPPNWSGDCTELFKQLPGVAAFLKGEICTE